MQAVLKFDLPEEREEFEMAVHAVDWHIVAHELDETLRTWLKHGHNFQTPDAALQAARDALWENMNDRNLEL